MTAVAWFLLVMYLIKSLGLVLLYRSHQRLAKISADLGKELEQAESKHREYRAAYRDLLDDYTRLHTAYKGSR